MIVYFMRLSIAYNGRPGRFFIFTQLHKYFTAVFKHLSYEKSHSLFTSHSVEKAFTHQHLQTANQHIQKNTIALMLHFSLQIGVHLRLITVQNEFVWWNQFNVHQHTLLQELMAAREILAHAFNRQPTRTIYSSYT